MTCKAVVHLHTQFTTVRGMINKAERLVKQLLLGAQDGHAALVEVMRVFFVGDVEVDGEDEVGASEVQIHGQRDLQTERERETL